jgi:hypothetical protein
VDAATFPARDAAIAAAAAALDADLVQAAVDDRYVDILRACARGGCSALQVFCGAVERAGDLDEAPAVALLAALADGDVADRVVRAVTWTMLAQRAASAWPHTFHEVLGVARIAMPLDVASYESVQSLGFLTACANTTTEPDTRDGQRMQFSRESLEHVIWAATRQRPARRDMLAVIPPWTACFVRGIKVCDEQLRELEQART